jgi:hypothetical protein
MKRKRIGFTDNSRPQRLFIRASGFGFDAFAVRVRAMRLIHDREDHSQRRGTHSWKNRVRPERNDSQP